MTGKDIVRRFWNKDVAPAEVMSGRTMPPMRDVERWFDDAWRGWPSAFGMFPPDSSSNGSYMPRVEVSETEAAVEVTAELPGIDQKDVQVTLHAEQNALDIRGEKKLQQERTEHDIHHSEISYGAFHRRVGLPATVDPEKVAASFRQGVLTVRLDKLKDGPTGARQIPIR